MSTVHTAASEGAGRLRELRERAERSIQQREASLVALDVCQRQLAAAQQESNRLRAVADKQDALLAANTKEIERLTGLARQTESWRDRAQRRIAALEAENQGLSMCAQELSAKNDALRSRNATVLRDGNKTRRELDELRQSTKRLEQAIESASADGSQRVRALESALAERNERVQALESALAERNERVQALELALAERNERVQTLQSALAERNERTDALETMAAEQADRARVALLSAQVELQQANEQRAAAEQVHLRDQELRLRAALMFHQVGEVFGAALRRAVGGLAWVALTEEWGLRLGRLPEPHETPDGELDALERRMRHWFVDTGFSRGIAVRGEKDAVVVEVQGAGLDGGDDAATVVAQAAVLVPLLLPSKLLALRDIAEPDDGRRLVFRPDLRRRRQADPDNNTG